MVQPQSTSFYKIINPLPPNTGGFFYASLDNKDGGFSVNVKISNETKKYNLALNPYVNSLSVIKALKPNTTAFNESNIDVPFKYNSS